ncbi:MAG TPA: hypothetical protein DIW23_10375 [Anaerolineae bacterium]|nr:hypothetical protein [Anaerolineae bacterium]
MKRKMQKQCVTCNQWKDEEEFNWRYKALGIRHPTCRDCHKPFRRNWYENNKERHLEQVKQRKHEARRVAREFALQYLCEHPCIVCGESDPRVLEFHHYNNKHRALSVMIAGGYPVKTIQKEIDKCDVLCANCHRKRTTTQLGWFRGKK